MKQLSPEATARPYKEGYDLLENEYLLKVRDEGVRHTKQKWYTGFMTKFTQKGKLPLAFADWNVYGYYAVQSGQQNPSPLPIYIVTETFRSGWQLVDWRIGKSQEWATVMHPLGYTVEIYLSNFLTLVKENVINHCVIEGEFKWEDHKLIKSVEPIQI